MKRDDWMLFILTFLTGAAIGMYIYFAVWKPVYAPEDINTEEVSASEWSVVGERRYDDSTEASFRLLSDGTYTYLSLDEYGEAVDRKEGRISRSLVEEITVSEATLSKYETSADCEVSSDAEYKYRYNLESETYILDTCNSALGHETDLSKSLEKVWDKVEGVSATYETPSKMLENWINENLGVNRNDN